MFNNYLDYRKIDGYNANINEILTIRGYGKSYGLHEKMLKHVLANKGRTFMYLVRRSVDIEDILSHDVIPFKAYLDDHKDIFYKADGACRVTMNRKGFFYDDIRIGHLFSLSKALRIKRLSFADVDYIMFDEFLIEERSDEKYLADEPNLFMNLYDTISRNRNNVKAYLLGNATVFYNPYNISWNIEKPFKKDGRLYQNGRILIYMKAPQDFIEYRKSCSVGQLIDGTSYADMALYNRFQGEQLGFMKKREKGCNYVCTLIAGSERVGVFIGNDGIYISEVYEPTSREIYCFDLYTQIKGAQIIGKTVRGTPVEIIINGYRNGLVYFETQKAKQLFYNILKKFI